MREMQLPFSDLDREKALHLYLSAVERGDDATIDRVLEWANADPALEAMIFEMHDLEAAQTQLQTDAASAALLRALIERHLPSGVTGAEEEDAELPPVTVAEVVSRIQSDALGQPQQKLLAAEASELTRRNQDLARPLPEKINPGSLARLFQELGINVSQQFQRCFRETALLLSMGRQQSQAQLAATRRQRHAAQAQKKAASQAGTAQSQEEN